MTKKSTSKLFENEEQEAVVDSTATEIPQEKSTSVLAPIEHTMPDDDIQDIAISAIKLKKVRINGDDNKILELNTSDLNIITRLEESYNKLNDTMQKVASLLSEMPETEGEVSPEHMSDISSALKELDNSMRKEVDYIFNAPVSAACCDKGSMYDPYDGEFMYEHIIEAMLALYERNLDKEFAKIRNRVNAKTSKYTKKYHR